jgi:hypothetical protein
MLKISKKIASQRYCNHIVGLFSSIKVVVTKGKLPLSTFGYPYQQLVTLSSTISYPLLASHSTGYTSSVTGYTYPQLATL